MKKPFLIVSLVLVILGCQCYAQATKSVTKDTLSYREKFDVLKSNPAIKHGKYTLSVKSSGKILTMGFYNNNLKDGFWHEYNGKDNVAAEGHFKDGKKIGEWNYYGRLWKIVNTYDFTRNELTYHLPTHDDSTHVYRVVRGKDTVETLLQRAPIYLSPDLMYRPLVYNIVYPAAAIAKKVAGRVVISFTVDENGHMRDYLVDQGLGYGCDEEALRIVKLIPEDWVPGKLNGKNVAISMRLPVVFNLR